MFQALTQWVWVHIRGVTLALTLAVSTFLLVRSPQSDLTPIRRGVLHLISAGQTLFRLPIRLASLEEENRYLRSRLLEKVLYETEVRELRLENARLRRMLEYKEKGHLELLVVRVLAHDAESPPTAITIDAGLSDGVRAYQAVIGPEGLLGRIDAEPGTHRALVRLITDPGLRVSVVVENEGRAMGILRREGTRMEVDNVPQEALVSEGDRVVTSGMGGIFPSGLFVGHVAAVKDDPHALFKEITIVPRARFDRLEEVFIIRSTAPSSLEPEARDAMAR